MIAIHRPATRWGWNARQHSSQHLAVEFAQATSAGEITDGQVRALVWWLREHALTAWPSLPMEFPTRAELAAGIADGKSDVFPRGDLRSDELQARIMALL